MDDTPMDDRLASLEDADPADAPDIADDIAATLASRLEAEEEHPAQEA